MDCKYKECHLSGHCRIKDVVENCSIHKRYLKVMNGEITPTPDIFLNMNDETSIKKYVERVKKLCPNLANKAEENARDVFKSINHPT